MHTLVKIYLIWWGGWKRWSLMDIKSANMQNWLLPQPLSHGFLYDQQTYFAITTIHCVCLYLQACRFAQMHRHTPHWLLVINEEDTWRQKNTRTLKKTRWVQNVRERLRNKIKADTPPHEEICTTVPFINAIYALSSNTRYAELFNLPASFFSVCFSRHQHAHGQTHVCVQQTHASHQKSSVTHTHCRFTQHSQDINNASNSSPASLRERGKRF